jgi:probable HAF family extracellular repeat protein
MKALPATMLTAGILTLRAWAANSIPDPTMRFPENNQLFRQTFDAIGLRARVVDYDGTITNVQFYLGRELLGNGTRIADTDEFIFMYGPLRQGNYSFSVVGYDNNGASKDSWPSHISVATNAPSYAIVDLETHQGDFSEEVRGINNSGAIVGFFNQSAGRAAFQWQNWSTRRIEASRFPDVFAFGVADDGTITGSVLRNDAYRPFVYSEARGLVEINSDVQAYPYAISRAGVVGAGTSQFYQPFYWDGTNFAFLPTLGGWAGEARAINNHGVIVGWSYTFQTATARAFIYTNGVMRELPTGSSDERLVLNGAYGINDRGDIVGAAEDAAFVYRNGVATRLGTLGAGHTARDINEEGVIVGNYSHELRGAAFICHDGVMINLDKLIPSEAGYHIENAVAINDRGEIAVTALRPGSTWPAVACLLSPRPLQRARRILNAFIVTTYPLPGPVIHEESDDLVTWRVAWTNNLNWSRYDTSEEITQLQSPLFRRVVQPR